ncbi:hypothetical protein D9M71_635900 [compost metagenome]
MLASVVEHLGQQQATAITQAWVVGAELVAGIDHRPWVGLFPQLVAAKQLGEHRQLGLGRVEVEQGHGRLARYHQARVCDGFGQDLGGERVAQAGEAVVEGELVEGFHGAAPGSRCHWGRFAALRGLARSHRDCVALRGSSGPVGAGEPSQGFCTE